MHMRFPCSSVYPDALLFTTSIAYVCWCFDWVVIWRECLRRLLGAHRRQVSCI
jgi:hypothetical protein